MSLTLPDRFSKTTSGAPIAYILHIRMYRVCLCFDTAAIFFPPQVSRFRVKDYAEKNVEFCYRQQLVEGEGALVYGIQCVFST